MLLVEAVLTLAFFGLFVALYFVPAGEEPFLPRPYAWPLLAALFFGILILDHWRRKRRARTGLSTMVPENQTGPSGGSI